MKHLFYTHFPHKGKTFGLLLLLLPCLLLLTGCKGNTYSKLLKQEKKVIDNYISRMDINVIDNAPKLAQGQCWGDKDYLSMPKYDNFYFHLVSPVDTTREKIVTGDIVNVRFRKYTLNEYGDTISYWTTDDAGDPLTFTVGTTATNNSCIGWHMAIMQMKYSGSECKIICPSTIGFDDDNSSVTPYGYDLKVTKRK